METSDHIVLYQQLQDSAAHINHALQHDDFVSLCPLLHTHAGIMETLRQTDAGNDPALAETLQKLTEYTQSVITATQEKYDQVSQALTLLRRKQRQITAYTHAKTLGRHR